MSYNQAMKHWKNHKKDKFYQQCGSSSMFIEEKEPTDDFQRFRNRVNKCGGIWCDKDKISFGTVKSSEGYICGYYAGYYPKAPEHTCGDYVIFEDLYKEDISLYAPYASEFGAIKKTFSNWNEVWDNFNEVNYND